MNLEFRQMLDLKIKNSKQLTIGWNAGNDLQFCYAKRTANRNL
ncbi:MAG: hypothetical protein QXK37_05445 [Candidatus Woesearchaeota archaeon]